MSKCSVYPQLEADWAWQPFGPDENDIFTVPGSHYRGFPVIKVSDKAKRDIEAGEVVQFTYKKTRYRAYRDHDGQCIVRTSDVPLRQNWVDAIEENGTS